MGKKILSLQNISSGYNKEDVVKDVSFDVREGQIFGLVGLNGAGKTTLIKTILGLRECRKGDVLLAPEDVAYMPERFDPPWFMNGFKFIQFSLKFYNKSITFEQAQEVAEKLSFDPAFLKKSVQTYSKGMRQKIGLIATVLTECPLIILDEPMSGLDPKARLEVKKMISDVKSSGRSVFMCSHILSDVSELCDEVAVFHNKTIRFLGAPDAMLKQGGSQDAETAFLNIIESKEAA